jgi:hypothetical protein
LKMEDKEKEYDPTFPYGTESLRVSDNEREQQLKQFV